MSHFSIISDSDMLHSQYVLIGQPVWDVKMAEFVSTAGDVLTSASAWIYVNEAEYCTQPCGDGRHTKVNFDRLSNSYYLSEYNPCRK